MKTKFVELLPIFLMLLSLIGGAAVWASGEHKNIRDWTAEQDFVTKTELKEIIKEQYVPRHEFVVVVEKLEQNKKEHEEIIKYLDKLDKKLDKIQGTTRHINFE